MKIKLPLNMLNIGLFGSDASVFYLQRIPNLVQNIRSSHPCLPAPLAIPIRLRITELSHCFFSMIKIFIHRGFIVR